MLCLSLCGESGLKSAESGWKLESMMSLPLRGEWIEIRIIFASITAIASLPLRGEWIEMAKNYAERCRLEVSPFAGRVDWNNSATTQLE